MARDNVVGGISDLRGGLNPELDELAEKAAVFCSRWDIFRNKGLHRVAGIVMQRLERTFGKTAETKAVVELLVDFGERVSDNLIGKNSVFSRDMKNEDRKKKIGSLKGEFLASMMARIAKAKTPKDAKDEMELMKTGLQNLIEVLKEIYPEEPVTPAKPSKVTTHKPVADSLHEAASGLREWREKQAWLKPKEKGLSWLERRKLNKARKELANLNIEFERSEGND